VSGVAEPVLDVRAISLRFGGLTVFEDISLSVARGELLALIGPNGAGKTSVLNCISGIYRPAGGDIRLEGASLLGEPAHRIAARGVARTFQHAELFPHLSVVENLLVARHARIGTRLWHDALFSRRARDEEVRHREAVEEVIEFVELERLRDEHVGNLSFAQQKVVGFARALAMQPRVLLLDEPSAGLNREAKETLARFVLRVRHQLGVPMIWVEHDMQMVADLADRICALNYGRFLVEGPPQQVLDDPRVIEAYLGRRRAPG
jgi:branched-chain amino acid transport system ATP-binding protein